MSDVNNKAITCVKCGTKFNTKGCRHCGKGMYEWKIPFFTDEYWKCNWCGHVTYLPPQNFKCPNPNCRFDNTPKGCFLTTACVKAKNLPDDCYELTTIRRFRDTVMKTDETLKPLVEEYYRNAPLIVSRINETKNAQEVYERIYREMILPCLSAIECGENEKAVDLYYSYYNSLLKEYLPGESK